MLGEEDESETESACGCQKEIECMYVCLCVYAIYGWISVNTVKRHFEDCYAVCQVHHSVTSVKTLPFLIAVLVIWCIKVFKNKPTKKLYTASFFVCA